MNPVQSWGAVAALAATVLMSCTETPTVNMNPWNPRLAETTVRLLEDTASVSEERKSELNALAQWTAESLNTRGQADLFSSARTTAVGAIVSRFGPRWCGRGWGKGYPDVQWRDEAGVQSSDVAAMQRAGFEVVQQDTIHGEANPTYLVSTGVTDMACFSKKYGGEPNPSEGFGAVMTCSSADRGCPVVFGADARFAIPYVDPKVSDGTDAEAATYDARLEQIGTEMLYLMGQVAARITR